MADVTHDFADDGFHEIHLTGKQLVFLFMATTVVAVVIFLCGVQVGRGAPMQRSQDLLSDPTAVSAAPASAAPVVADSGPPAAEPPAPPAESDELSYKKRLEGEPSAAESLKAKPERLAAAPAPAPAPAPVAEAPAPTPAAAPVARQQTPAAKPASQVAGTTGSPQPGTWVLQVHALRDAKVANNIVHRLSQKGYPAFVVASGAPTSMYRVFVGRYKERGEAERVADKLKKEEQFNPWITR